MIEFHRSLISYKLSTTQSRCPSPDKEYLLKISYDPTAIYDCFLSGKITCKRNSEAEENSKKKDSTGVSKNRNRCRLSIKIRMKVKEQLEMFEMEEESSETKEFSDCGKSRSQCPMKVVTDETEQVQEPSE